jgi:Phosphotransferase enzyme family
VRGQQKLLQIIIDAVPIVKNEQFVLAHPDFDVQNFLVSQDGYLTGVLDWDGVATYPRYLGYARYPGWITRDWDPMAYRYGFEEPAWKKEDSPETLRKFRRLYRRIVEEELGREEADAMVNSHLYEAIDIAARNPMHSAAIVNLLVRRCIQEPLFEVSFEDDDEQDGEAEAAEGERGAHDEFSNGNGTTVSDIGDDEKQVSEDEGYEGDRPDAALLVDHAADLHYIPGWVFDLCTALGEGRVKETQIAMLRQRFREVLTVTTHIGHTCVKFKFVVAGNKCVQVILLTLNLKSPDGLSACRTRSPLDNRF